MTQVPSNPAFYEPPDDEYCECPLCGHDTVNIEEQVCENEDCEAYYDEPDPDAERDQMREDGLL